MGERTSIQWSEATWNPVTGCTKVSPGCDNCYAERITNRLQGPGAFDKVVLHPERLELPLHWKSPRMIFVNSMSDLFHRKVPEHYIYEVFRVMAHTPQHTFQVLTKRPDRMAMWFYLHKRIVCQDHFHHLPLPNVWLGTSIENQRLAFSRLETISHVPAVVRFASVEPLLGAIDLKRWLRGGNTVEGEPGGDILGFDAWLSWVIVGGESGRRARPMHPDWVRRIRDDCAQLRVPFFFKQWGEWRPATLHEVSQEGKRLMRFNDYNKSVYMRHVGKRAAGSLLDGREHREWPVGFGDAQVPQQALRA